MAETYAYNYTPQGRTSIYVIESGGNGVSGGSVSSVAYSPDAHGRLLQEVPGDASVADSLYRYDGNDNLTEVDQSTNLHTVQTPVITYAYSNTNGSESGNWLPNELVSVTHNSDYPACYHAHVAVATKRRAPDDGQKGKDGWTQGEAMMETGYSLSRGTTTPSMPG